MKRRKLGLLRGYRWLQKPTQGHFITRCAMLAFGLAFYSALASYANVLLIGVEKVQASSALGSDNILIPWNIFAGLVIAPVWEEIVIRVLPLGTFLLWRNKDYNTLGKMFQLFLILISTSVAFGFFHAGNSGILTQGVTGFALGLVFLKASMPETNTWAGIAKGATACIAVHSIHNTILLLPVIIFITLQT